MEGARVHVEPIGLVAGDSARELIARGAALPLAGGPIAFTAAIVTVRRASTGSAVRETLSVAELGAWAAAQVPALAARLDVLLARLRAARAPIAGGVPGRPRIMGVVNVTPDSFSDGGEFLDPGVALAHAEGLVAAGADIVDIGGESTRPGASPVSRERQLARVIPVITALAARRGGDRQPAISIDTRSAAVMRAALAAGADLVNDVSGLRHDPASLGVVAETGAPAIVMHSRGTPRTMNEAPAYADVARDVFDELEDRIAACEAGGIDRNRLIVDPGIGFAKRGPDNLAILRALTLFHGLGCPLMLGISRKGLGGDHHRRHGPRDRLPASLAGATHALERGVTILRVHDVAATRQVVDLWSRLSPPPG